MDAFPTLKSPQGETDGWFQGGLNSPDDREGDGEEEGVEESVDGLEHGDVLDQGVVPRESKHEGGHEDHENEEENLGECVNWAAGLDNFFNHLIHRNIFFPDVL
jgi:hypothetical protein